MIKDRRPILRPFVRSLAIERGGIMRFPEGFEQLFVVDDAGIKLNLDDLGVPGLT
ncbi:hypothetical protein SDC9_147152 [bioreactor metagenome]|uniref:Uncharacterized protein n=1 Tax=bioreactor metagenome TaxID=1076179 RepID=A0A645EDA5_9ZZZZ